MTVRWVPNVVKQPGDFLTSDDEAEVARRWAWWRRAISEQQPPLQPTAAVKPKTNPPGDDDNADGRGGQPTVIRSLMTSTVRSYIKMKILQ